MSILTAAGGGAAGALASGQEGWERVLVKFGDGTSVVEQRRALSAAGAQRRGAIPALGVDVARMPSSGFESRLRGLAANAAVDYAERDAEAHLDELTHVIPNDEAWPYQWSPVLTRATTAWSLTTGSAAVKVAVLDTGVTAVPDLKNKLAPGYNVLDGSSNVTDNHGHGTLAAGVVGAQTNNVIGVASYCWQCLIMPVKVMETGSGYMSDIAAGIVWAADSGAQVISMSLSGSSGTKTLANAVGYAADRGVVLTAAAGNNGNDTPRYPAAYADVIGVAGTDSLDVLYTWSNYGSWVDVSAPGVNRSTNVSGGVSMYSGTSSATPVVAGIAGLAFSYSSGISAAQVRQAIQSGALSLGFVKHGRVDAYATLASLASQPAPSPEPEPSPSPGPSPEPEPSPSTFSDNLAGKNLTRSYSVAAGAGEHHAVVTLSRGSSVTLEVYDAAGVRIGSVSGGSGVSWTATLPTGTYTYAVSGKHKTSFAVEVTHPAA